jgi:transcriptional regulator with XRE-family HTH domain
MCAFYPSISDVCRRLSLNRQQFNKYLNGSAIPSKYNLKKICDFFGVEEFEIYFPHGEFKRIFARKHKEEASLGGHILRATFELLLRGQSDLGNYQGYYYRYYPSAGFPGNITRTICLIGHSGDGFYTKTIGSLSDTSRGRKITARYRYTGVPLLLKDRLFLVEHETLQRDILCYTVLYGAYRGKIDLLVGFQVNVAGRRNRTPSLGNVVFEFLGREIDLRAALKSCGLFGWNNPAVDPWIKDHLSTLYVDENKIVWLPEP